MTDDTLSVSIVQYAPVWEDVAASLLRLGDLLQPLKGKTDLILLPEMFPTGFSTNVDKICSQENNILLLQWMYQQAQASKAMIAGSIAIKENNSYYNRYYWIAPDGTTKHYDKHHLFSMSLEPKYFTSGNEPKQFEWRGWKIKPVLCYEIRFPEWCRNNRSNPYDILICAASWPSVRSDVWITLLKARAIENQCYVAGVNRVGVDGAGLHHKGDSLVYSPKGEIIARIPENEENTVTFEISLSKMNDFRRKFPVLDDIDDLYNLHVSSRLQSKHI